MILKNEIEERLADIKSNPHKHCHDFTGLKECCYIEGEWSETLLDAHQGLGIMENV